MLAGVDEIGIVKLDNRDVVRHPLVQKIVKAYETYEEKEELRKKRIANGAVYNKNKKDDRRRRNYDN